MLVYAGMDEDSAPIRSAKLKALKEYYKESDPRALNMLGAADLGKSNSSRGKNLVVNSHGNADNFAGTTAEAFYSALTSKGFGEGSFEAIYLMACNIGEQAQDNSIHDNFAKDFAVKLRHNGISTKVYAPRGTLSYKLHMASDVNTSQSYYVVDELYIKAPERNYPLEEGVLLVHF